MKNSKNVFFQQSALYFNTKELRFRTPSMAQTFNYINIIIKQDL